MLVKWNAMQPLKRMNIRVHNTLLRAKWQVEGHSTHLKVSTSPHTVVKRDALGRMSTQRLRAVASGRQDFRTFVFSSLCLSIFF